MAVKIALIDAKINVKEQNTYFHIKQNKHKELFNEKAILKETLVSKTNFEVIDINIEKEFNQITANDLVLSIKKAINLHVDIINLNVEVSQYSKELFLICQEAIENNILIVAAASYNNKPMCPANFKNVLKVQVATKQEKRIQKINDSTISLLLNYNFIKNNNSLSPTFSTYLAAAYFCKIFADIVNTIPLCDKFKVLYKQFGVKLDSNLVVSVNTDNKNKLKDFLKKKTFAFVILPNIDNCHHFLSFSKIVPNFIAYYNHQERTFLDCKTNQPTSDYEAVLIINTSTKAINISPQIKTLMKDKEIFFIGKFNIKENNLSSLLLSYRKPSKNLFYRIKKPTILICGSERDTHKFEVQINLYSQLKKNGVKLHSVTNNYIGSLYNFDVFAYPWSVVFPDTVLAINSYMWQVETCTEIDGWLVNVGGGIEKTESGIFNFGKLSEAFLCAVKVDIIVFCVHPKTNLEFIQRKINQLHYYNQNIIFYIVLSDTILVFSPSDSKTNLEIF